MVLQFLFLVSSSRVNCKQAGCACCLPAQASQSSAKSHYQSFIFNSLKLYYRSGLSKVLFCLCLLCPQRNGLFRPENTFIPILLFFCACMCTCKGGAGGRNSCPKRQTSISLPKLETYLNLLAGNQLKGWFPTHAQGRVSSSAEFLKSPYSLLHRVWHFRRKTQLSVVCVRLHWFRLEKSVLMVCIISCPDKISTEVFSHFRN